MTAARSKAERLSVGQFWRALAPWQRRELLAGLWLVPAVCLLTLGYGIITP